jgi:spermidine synthase
MTLDNRWFTEIFDAEGYAVSLRIQGTLHEEQTPCQRIEIYQTENFGNLMVIDGCVMLTARDNFIYHEMLAHPALFSHSAPKRILIIGGGDCGTLREVLKHPEVEQAIQVEIDERVTRLAEQYFPELCVSNTDPRVAFHFTDGIRWVEGSPDDHYDIILVDSTDPVGPATGLFSEPFYRACHRALRTGGILAQQSESPLFHMSLIKSMHAALRSAGFLDTLALTFPQPTYPSGWWSVTLAGKDMVLSGYREDAAAEKRFPTRYYNAAVHRAAMASPEFLYQALMAG